MQLSVKTVKLSIIRRQLSQFLAPEACSVVMQAQCQHYWKSNSHDEGGALQEPQVSVLVRLGSGDGPQVRQGLVYPAVAVAPAAAPAAVAAAAAATAADLWENVHRSHVEERPG